MVYVPNPTVDGWVAERRPSLLYRSGEAAREGDCVKRGLEPEDQWSGSGSVLRIDIAGGVVVMDLGLVAMTCPPEELYLLGRKEPVVVEGA